MVTIFLVKTLQEFRSPIQDMWYLLTRWATVPLVLVARYIVLVVTITWCCMRIMRLPAVLVTPLHIRFDPPVRLSRSTPSVSLTERHLHLSSAGKTVSYNFSVLLQFYLLTIRHHGGFNQRSWDIQSQHLFIFYENLFYKFIYRKWAYFVLTL